MIEVIIGSAKYGFEELDCIMLEQGQDEVKAWIILKVDIPPALSQTVTVNKTDEPNYFNGQVQDVRRREKGKYEVFCIGAPKADSSGVDTKNKSSRISPSTRKRRR